MTLKAVVVLDRARKLFICLMILSLLANVTSSYRSCPTGCHCDVQRTYIHCDFAWLRQLTRNHTLKSLRLLHSPSQLTICNLPYGLHEQPWNSSQLTQLTLRNCSIERTPNILKSLPAHLTALSLPANRLSQLPSLALPQLLQLDLAQNALTSVRTSVFVNCNQLQQLNLSRNTLRELHEHALVGLSRLQSLDVSGNKLHALPGLAQVPHLLRLDASDNPLYLLDSLEPLLQLRELHLNSVGAQDFPRWAVAPSLQVLSLANNVLTALQRSRLERYPLLTHLHVQGNRIRLIEADALIGSAHLLLLDLSSNQLTQLVITLPVSLRELRVGHNQLIILDARTWLSSLPSLRSLVVEYNPLQQILLGAEDVAHNMSAFALDGHELNGQFSVSSSLSELDLSGCTQLNIPQLLPLAQSLRTLRLNHLNQSWSMENLLKPIQILSKLELHASPLMAHSLLDSLGQWQGRDQLQLLDLRACDLSSVHVHSLTSLRKLKQVKLSENPLHCDGVHFAALAALLRSQVFSAYTGNLNVQDADKLHCSSPHSMAGVQVMQTLNLPVSQEKLQVASERFVYESAQLEDVEGDARMRPLLIYLVLLNAALLLSAAVPCMLLAVLGVQKFTPFFREWLRTRSRGNYHRLANGTRNYIQYAGNDQLAIISREGVRNEQMELMPT